MKKIFAFIILIIILGVAWALWAGPYNTNNNAGGNSNASSTDNYVVATTTLRGVFACLPHKGDGPSTLECAYGMKAQNGSYYALDFSDTPVSSFDLPMDTLYSVTGLLVPIEMISSNQWQSYDIRGIMKVSSYEELAKPQSYNVGSTFTLKLKQKAEVSSTTINVWAVTEDSRCPSDVQCIQAGRVKIAVNSEWAGNSSTTEMTVGDLRTWNSINFKLTKVDPYPVSTNKASDDQYRFTFVTSKK